MACFAAWRASGDVNIAPTEAANGAQDSDTAASGVQEALGVLQGHLVRVCLPASALGFGAGAGAGAGAGVASERARVCGTEPPSPVSARFSTEVRV